MCNEPLCILAVDPSMIFLDGLEQCLEKLGNVQIAYARDQSEALARLNESKLHLVVLGHGLDEIRAFELCRIVRAKDETVGIVMLSPQASEDLFQVDALVAGTNACLGIEISQEKLIEAVQMVLQKGVLFAPAILRLMKLQEDLTAREMQVLRELADGKTDREIGYALDIELPTVKSHVCSILGKLHCASRKDAVRRARRQILGEKSK